MVMLTNGDRLTGELKQLERGSLTVKAAGSETKLPLSRVEAIGFGRGQRSEVGRRVDRSEPSPRPSLKGRGIAGWNA